MERKKRKLLYAVNRLKPVARKQKIKLLWKSLPVAKKSPSKRNASLTIDREVVAAK